LQPYLTDAAIKKAIAKAESEKSEDQERVSVIEARNNANAAMASAETLLSGSEQVSGERERRINEKLAALGLALESDTQERIRVATQDLRAALGSANPMASGGFNQVFADLFGTGARPATTATSGARSVVRPKAATKTKPKVLKKDSGAPSTALASDETARSPKSTTLGKIFGGGDFTLDSSLCFVLMPFASKFQAIYEDHIRRIVTDAGLSSQRADEIASTNMITWDIWERLNTARFVIADLTDRNSNVFYEVGLAHAISKEVILLTQSMGDIPFDLQSLRFIVYEFTPRGMLVFEKKLRTAIASVLQGS
jgi:Hsp70 protein